MVLRLLTFHLRRVTFVSPTSRVISCFSSMCGSEKCILYIVCDSVYTIMLWDSEKTYSIVCLYYATDFDVIKYYSVTIYILYILGRKHLYSGSSIYLVIFTVIVVIIVVVVVVHEVLFNLGAWK